jgi:hypothetical protein
MTRKSPSLRPDASRCRNSSLAGGCAFGIAACLSLGILAARGTAGCGPGAAPPAPWGPRLPKPVRVILDTDIGPDVDDAGAAAILNALADRGEARIVAMCCCTSSEWGAPCLDAINTYYGRPDIPIGTNKSPGFLTKSKYNEQVAREFPNDLKTGRSAPEATTLYRQVLAAQPDRSVAVCAVGPLTNLKRLLDSGPDAASPLVGRDLVAQKVALLSVMGGKYPSGKEFNFEMDAPAAAQIAASWPTPILFSGFEIGARILTGRRLHSETPGGNPVRAAYALFPGPDKDRESWDLTAVLAAVRGPERYWEVRTGSNEVDPQQGGNRWASDPDRSQAHLVEKTPPREMKQVLEDLMVQRPHGKHPGT